MLISSLTQVQRYLAALETLLMEVQANDTNIFFCCRAHDIIVAEQKNISMFMWCIEVLQSHTRFISFSSSSVSSFSDGDNQDFAGV